MASKSLGGISWQVDADTTGAVDSIASMGKQIDNAEVKLLKLDKVTSKYTATLKKSGNQISKTGVVINKYGKINEHATTRMKGLISQQAKFTKSATGVNKAISSMGRKSGQAGIQMQQFIGQIQGGQNAMLALSAQSADLGFVLGAPLLGAVVGITASLVGMLIPALFSSGKETEELTGKIKELVKASTLSEAQSRFMVDQTDDEIKANKKSTQELEKKIKQGQAIVDNYDRIAAKKKAGIKLENDEIGVLGTMDSVVKKIRKTHLEQAAAIDTNKSSLKDLNKKRSAYILSTKKSIDEQESEVSETVKFKTALDNLKDGLDDQINTMGMSTQEVAHYKATQMGATEEMHKQIDAIYEHKKALEDDAKSFKEMDALRKASEKNESKKKAETETKAVSIADNRGDPVETLKAQKTAELAILEQAEKDGLQLHTDYSALRKSIDDEYAQAEQAAREEKFAAESETNALLLSSIDALGEASASAIGGLISGTLDAKEAVASLASTIANEAISALVQMGMQYAKNALLELAAESSVAAGKESVMAAASVQHTAVVSATVAELASLGAAAAMASTAAIPLVGPEAAPAAGTAMAGLIGAAGSAAISSAPLAGMREHGGGVNAGQTYEVGEKNKPEMLMIPGNNGKVFSNAEMKSAMGGGGSGSFNQTINNHASGDGYQVRSRGDGLTAPQVIDIIKTQMGNPNSPSRRAQESTSNVRNKIRGGR